jgi:hypothetical protein
VFFDQHFFYSAGVGVTQFDSFPAAEAGAWTTIGLLTGEVLHPSSPVLDAQDGFTLTVELAIDDEDHDLAVDIDGDGRPDEAGFSILILDREARGTAVNFWEDRIWTSSDRYVSDSAPLAQAEGVAQLPAAMATLRRYALTIKGGAYRLSADGIPILEGPTRSYDHFGTTLNPFNKPNIINIGDASFTAGARARLGAIAVEPCYAPAGPPVLAVTADGSGMRLNWNSIPGVIYTVQAAGRADDWSDLHTFQAESFSSAFFEAFQPGVAQRLYRIEETLP